VTLNPKETLVTTRSATTLWAWALVALTTCSSLAQAQTEPEKPSPARPKPASLTELAVRPKAAPVPAFRYRLLPLTSELNPGDAAPIYLRIRHELDEESWKSIGQKVPEWLDLPLDKFPTAEARAFVDRFAWRLEQMAFAARRETCDWGYTLPEQRLSALEILLPDAQGMRAWSRLLALKARVEIAEGKFDEAVHTLETGIAFSRHVAQGPFLINGLIGAAIALDMLAQVEELVSRPDAPNLYWALTSLPRPLVYLRRPLDTEYVLVEGLVPELTDFDRLQTDAEWSSRLAHLHARLAHVKRTYLGDNKEPKLQIETDLARFTEETLPHARRYLRERQGAAPVRTERMSAGEAITRYLSGAYREVRDRWFEPGYVPLAHALRLVRKTPKHSDDKALNVLLEMLPPMEGILQAEGRLERKLDALRIVEALRIYAEAHGGSLPDRLDQVTEVPIPADPSTGNPFECRREGDAILLPATKPQGSQPWPEYRVSLRR
jgi:hypothetical protein